MRYLLFFTTKIKGIYLTKIQFSILFLSSELGLNYYMNGVIKGTNFRRHHTGRLYTVILVTGIKK